MSGINSPSIWWSLPVSAGMVNQWIQTSRSLFLLQDIMRFLYKCWLCPPTRPDSKLHRSSNEGVPRARRSQLHPERWITATFRLSAPHWIWDLEYFKWGRFLFFCCTCCPRKPLIIWRKVAPYWQILRYNSCMEEPSSWRFLKLTEVLSIVSIRS